jgi:hypothetical protein
MALTAVPLDVRKLDGPTFAFFVVAVAQKLFDIFDFSE